MHDLKYTFIQKTFLDIFEQVNKYFSEKGQKLRDEIQKFQTCKDNLEKHVILDDSNNQGLESSKPLQNKMKLEQKELLVSIIRNLDSIESIKLEFNNLQKSCNELANTILIYKREIEEKYKNCIPAIKQVDKQLMMLNEKDYKVITRLKQPRGWMIQMFDIFIEVTK